VLAADDDDIVQPWGGHGRPRLPGVRLGRCGLAIVHGTLSLVGWTGIYTGFFVTPYNQVPTVPGPHSQGWHAESELVRQCSSGVISACCIDSLRHRSINLAVGTASL
jgi:hypothetical protein